MQETNGARVGRAAPEASLEGAGGAEVILSDLWREETLVLLFMRHLG